MGLERHLCPVWAKSQGRDLTLRSGRPSVLVPFAAGFLRDETRDGAPDAKFVRMVDDESYWRLLSRYWRQGNAFVIVEHDIAPTREQIDTLWECPHDWCAAAYSMNGIVAPALGFVKFSATLLGRTAGLLDAILEPYRHWRSLDSMIIGELHRRRFTEHLHQPAVRHLHEPEKTEPQRYELTRLKFIGDGTRYLNGIPAADFETWDAEQVAICLESGLYSDVSPARRGRPPRIDKIEQPDYIQKFIPFTRVESSESVDAPVIDVPHKDETIVPPNPLEWDVTKTDPTTETKEP